MNTRINTRYLPVDPKTERHPFQMAILEWVESKPSSKLLVVDAPVGSGKSKVIEDLAFGKFVGKLVVTYPTKILIQTQCQGLRESAKEHGQSLNFLPRDTPEPGGLNFVEYTGDSLLQMARQNRLETYPNRGVLLDELLSQLTLLSSKKDGQRIVSTPDVLHLVATQKYKNSRSIELAFKSGLFIFDEFHLYQDLQHFYDLLSIIFERWEGRVVLMSATPIWEQSVLKNLCSTHKADVISSDTRESQESTSDRCFNYSLDCHVHDMVRTSRISEEAELLTSILANGEGPAAFICDSVFRLRHLMRFAKKEIENAGWQVLEYSGDRKEAVEKLEGKILIMGTAAIEVGITFRFTTLIMEASNWASAVQRLGRVGRLAPGVVHIITRKTFRGILDNVESIGRNQFEREILKEVFSTADREPSLAGEMFRGDSHPFALYDPDTDEVYFGDENLFSRYDVPYRDADSGWRNRERDEKEAILTDFGIPSRCHEEILLRDKVFPLWSILRGRLRDRYEKVTAKYSRQRHELVINNSMIFEDLDE